MPPCVTAAKNFVENSGKHLAPCGLLRYTNGYGTTTTEIVAELCGYNLPDTAVGVIALLQGKLALVPVELRASARLDLEGGYDESARLVLTYERPSTAKELRERKDAAERERLREERQERAMLAALQAKYGDVK